MNKNRTLLKEAIADAKTLKATAIANAKAALEESFTPRLQSMLATKLEEMEKEEVDEVVLENEELDLDESSASKDEEMDLDEILNEIEEELDEADKTEADEAKDEDEEAEEEATEDAEEAEEGTEEDAEEFDLEEMSEEELQAFIENTIADMVVAGELPPGENFEAEEGVEGEEGMEGEEYETVDGDEEIGIEIEDDELENTEIMENESDSLDEISLDVTDQEMLLSLLAGMVGMPVAALAASYAKDGIEAVKKLVKGKDKSTDGENVEEMSQEIDELKSELNETNLLNSKLLYVNKIFKSKNLTENQKLKVITTFDKVKTVREAKMVYTTLEETLKTTKKPIREHRGSASKSAGSAPKRTAKQPIMEVNQQVARWQKLAGINEQTKH